LHTVAELLTERPSFSDERSMAGQIAEVLHPAATELDGGRPVPLVRRAVDELAALRRVATLVAGGAQPGEVFIAVADELARLIGAEATFVSSVDLSSADGPGSPAADPCGEREEPEGYGTVLGSYGRVTGEVPVGFRMKLSPGSVITAALRTGRPARANGEALAKGPFGAIVGRLGIRAAVATPIVVEGRYRGVTVAGTSREDFPAGTESRMADFMELAAMAIANARAEQELRELAETQAALRRLAMLVARGEPAETVFAPPGWAATSPTEQRRCWPTRARRARTCGSGNRGRAIRRPG
jgi:GAF domain-containing protein